MSHPVVKAGQGTRATNSGTMSLEPLCSASPTLACRAIDARWGEVLAAIEKLGEAESEAAVAMLVCVALCLSISLWLTLAHVVLLCLSVSLEQVQWVDLATAALAKTPPPVSPRTKSDGRCEPERPAHAAARLLHRHTLEATAAIEARVAVAPASAAAMRPWQRQVAQILDDFQTMMASDSQLTPHAVETPTKEFFPQHVLSGVAVSAQAVLLSPPAIVIHATAVVEESNDVGAMTRVMPSESYFGRLCRFLTCRPPLQRQSSPSRQEATRLDRPAQVQLHTAANPYRTARSPSSRGYSAMNSMNQVGGSIYYEPSLGQIELR